MRYSDKQHEGLFKNFSAFNKDLILFKHCVIKLSKYRAAHEENYSKNFRSYNICSDFKSIDT